MKKLSTCLIALGLLFAVKAPGAQPPSHSVNYRAMQKSFDLIGMEVKNQQGLYLGDVEDLAIDIENARLVEVIVASGGFFGFGRKMAAVPPGAFSFDTTGNNLCLNVSKEKFKAAPRFKLSKWDKQCQSQCVAEDYLFYGQEPYFAADGQKSKSGNTASEPLGYIQRCSKLIFFPVKNLQNEPLGEVTAFLFGLLDGAHDSIMGNSSLRHVIVRSYESRKRKIVVQARALRFTASHDALYMDISTQAFKNKSQFDWSSDDNYTWHSASRNVLIVEGDSGRFQLETYSNKSVSANSIIQTRQNVEEGSTAIYTPLVQGTSYRDVAKTHETYTAIRGDIALSANAENVEVGTFNGLTTLRGHVNTKAEKSAIGEIAIKAGQGLPENVSNLLEVRQLPVAK